MIVVRATFIRSPRIAIKLEDFLRAIDTLLYLCLAFLVLLLVNSFSQVFRRESNVRVAIPTSLPTANNKQRDTRNIAGCRTHANQILLT